MIVVVAKSCTLTVPFWAEVTLFFLFPHVILKYVRNASEFSCNSVALAPISNHGGYTV